MASLDYNNPFQGWILSPEELLQGQVLTLLQKQVIHNERTAYLSMKMNLKYDPEHPLKFQQEEAELQGKIGVLSYLLEMSTLAETTLNGGRPNQIVISSNPQE